MSVKSGINTYLWFEAYLGSEKGEAFISFRDFRMPDHHDILLIPTAAGSHWLFAHIHLFLFFSMETI
ncbi:hypothetical protein ACE38V_05475 [Cytobacillus sp. Hz8]|uniref:hypothetical protein n=1 Tax=Cytobacillus sp. Hz8 TaxID=3347168 RepID=UPI0035D62951